VKELSYLNKYFFKYKRHFIVGVLLIIISNIFQIIPAQLVRRALDLVIDNIRLHKLFQGLELQDDFYGIFAESVFFYALLILIMALLRGAFLFLTRQTIIVMSRLVEYDLKNEIYEHYQTLPLSFYRRNNTGDLMNRISEDVSRVRMFFGPCLMYGINLIVLFLILIPYMFSVNATLTLYALIPLPFLSFSIRVIKSFVREDDSINKFTEASNDYKDKSLKLTSINALFFPLIMGLIGFSTILVVYIGGAEVMRGTVSFGNIAEFIIYVNLLTWPVTALGWITSITQRAEASQKRINEFLKEKNDIVSTSNLTTEIDGGIKFENVSFVYPDSGIRALDGISFEIEKGKSLAIIGTTGSGKSTIANLMGRMYDVDSGQILIDNRDIKEYDLLNLRGQMGFVPQDVFLFSDTIFNNIAFGLSDYAPDTILKAAKDADLSENIERFPEGFNTKIGERGITLSGGQKQRLSIARALAREPKILILDDALSAVDTNTENTILKSMEKIMKNRTSIIISHRISSAKLADKIIVLDEGKVIERGTNESLLAANGVYKDLYEKQLLAEQMQ
jgi:ATP-binding cassette subfamily B protein